MAITNDPILKAIRERREKLNNTFAWNENNIKKLQAFNNHIRKLTEDAYHGILQIKKNLDQRLQEGESIYKAYTITAHIGATECSQNFSFDFLRHIHWEHLNEQMYVAYCVDEDYIKEQEKEILTKNWCPEKLSDILGTYFQEVPMHFFTNSVLTHSINFAYEDVINTELSDLRVWYKISL